MTPTQEWPAKDYAIGSYIQASIAEKYLAHLAIKPRDQVLDIGCGNGAFSRKILEKMPEVSFLGIDASENMLKLAREELAAYPQARLQQANVLTMKFKEQFDWIISFWCLQWCTFAIESAFMNIYHALKPGGKILTLFPAGDDPYITSYYALKESGKFNCLNNFKAPVDYQHFHHLEERIEALAFKQIKVERFKHRLELPSLDLFRKFVNGIAFFQGQVPLDEVNIINDAMVRTYELECEKNHQGKYLFNCSIYLVKAEK